jgi:acetolactate synthase small subunit
MGFVQIIEYKTQRFDEVKALVDKFRANLPDSATAPVRGTVTKDRDRPDTYLSIIEFESYEKAMENSNRPETSEMAQAMGALCDGPPTFYNLDVVDQM